MWCDFQLFSLYFRNGQGKEQFGNELGIRVVCPLGHAHKGTGYCTYSGAYSRGFFHGFGELLCLSGQHYKGHWHRGTRHGQVSSSINLSLIDHTIIHLPSISDWQGAMHYMKNGEMGDPARHCVGGVDAMYRSLSFSGTWDMGVRQGVGMLTYANGDTLEGNFRSGQPHGVMVYRFASTGKTRLAQYDKGTRSDWIVTKHSTAHSLGKGKKASESPGKKKKKSAPVVK